MTDPCMYGILMLTIDGVFVDGKYGKPLIWQKKKTGSGMGSNMWILTTLITGDSINGIFFTTKAFGSNYKNGNSTMCIKPTFL